jgi:pullulanase/glycogen debranching enzyme
VLATGTECRLEVSLYWSSPGRAASFASWNCGVEGPTDHPMVAALRNPQVKNFFTLELLSAGTPMLLMGDEVRRTQRSNNNAYCEGSDISWFDWSSWSAWRYASICERAHQITSFVMFWRKGLRSASINCFVGRASSGTGVGLKRPEWSDHSRSLAFTGIAGRRPFARPRPSQDPYPWARSGTANTRDDSCDLRILRGPISPPWDT